MEHFDEVITNSLDHWFVGVYCDDCVPCQKLAPIYEKLESQYPHLLEFKHEDDLFPQMSFARVNYVVMPEILNRFTLKVVPTILYFGDDKENPSRYIGPLVEDSIEDWAYAHVGGTRIVVPESE